MALQVKERYDISLELLPGIEGVVSVPIDRLVTLWEVPGFHGAEVLRDNRALNKTHARRLAESHGRWPPIKLVHFRNNEQVTNYYQPLDAYAIVDGRHRYEASRKFRYNVVRSVIETYKTPVDVVHAAILANSNHGIASTPKLRMAHALWLYEQVGNTETIEDIASIAGVTARGLMQAIRREEEIEEELETENEVTELPPLTSFTISLYKSLDALREKSERDGLFYNQEDDIQQVSNALCRIVDNLPIKERGYTSTFIAIITRILNNVTG